MDTKARMVKERLRNSAILTVCGSHWLACCNKEGITRLEACQVRQGGNVPFLNQIYHENLVNVSNHTNYDSVVT